MFCPYFALTLSISPLRSAQKKHVFKLSIYFRSIPPCTGDVRSRDGHWGIHSEKDRSCWVAAGWLMSGHWETHTEKYGCGWMVIPMAIGGGTRICHWWKLLPSSPPINKLCLPEVTHHSWPLRARSSLHIMPRKHNWELNIRTLWQAIQNSTCFDMSCLGHVFLFILLGIAIPIYWWQ